MEITAFYISCAVILITLIILALPLLKIYKLNNAEHLEGMDFFLAGASLVIGPSVLVLFFFLLITNVFHDRAKERNKLEDLHINLSKNFKKELENTIAQLSYVREFIPPNLERFDDSIISEKQPFKFFDTQNIDNYYTDVWKISIWNNNFKYFNSIFWTDSSGNIKIYLSSEKNTSTISSIKHRDYVMDILNGKSFPFNEEDIAFESIRSISNGNYEIGIGMTTNNKHLPVLATSFSLVSLMDPILEEGYGFCFFNREGQTLFHSEIQRNINEDFLKETGEIFNPYLKSGISHFTSLSYMGKDHNMYLNKVSELEGYYLATFLDKSHIFSPNAIALIMTLEMQLAYFTFLLLAYLIIFLSAYKRTNLKQKVSVFNWILTLNFIKEHSIVHFRLFMVNFIVLIYYFVTIIFYGVIIYSPDLLIYNILFSGLLIITLNFWILFKALPDNERKDTQFNLLGSTRSILTIMATYGVLMLVGKNFLMVNFDIYLIILEFLILSLIFCGIYGVLLWDIKGFKTQQIQGKYHRAMLFILNFFKDLLDYKFYTCFLIILFSVIPTLIFFSINYNIEKEIYFKHNTVALKERIDNWKEIKAAQFYNDRDGVRIPIIDSLDIFVENMTKRDSLNHALPESIKFSHTLGPIKPLKGNDIMYTDLYHKTRIDFNQYGLNSQGFINNDQDSTNFWYFDGKGVNFKNFNFPSRITGPIDSFKTLFIQNWWLIVLFFIMVILILYSLLNTVINKVSGLEVGKLRTGDDIVIPPQPSQSIMIRKEIRIFVSYAHKDHDYFKVFAEEFGEQLNTSRKYKFNTFDDRQIILGTDWNKKLETEVVSCQVGILLLSSAFVNSEYIHEKELQAMIERLNNKEEFILIPIYFKAFEFDEFESLKAYQFFKPKGAKYGHADKGNNLCFSHLVSFKNVNGTNIALPNPNRDDYLLDLRKEVLKALDKKF